ncbi:MAG: hypothetical protein HY036_10810 [Nitrospirae bacterium]|nr:hypothetical protein [Nitrospirota bacterium]
MNTNPAFLYRAFDKEEYAFQFINNGRFRLGSLENFRKIKDENRQDESEGESRIYIKGELPVFSFNKQEAPPVNLTDIGTVPGFFHSWGKWMNPTYLFCTCGPNVDLNIIRKKYGIYIVKINAPMRFLAEINSSNAVNSKMEFTRTRKCSLEKVCYSKDQIQELDPDPIKETRLNYLQKHPKDSDDYEYRYIIVAKSCANEEVPESHLYFDLNQKLEYVEII